MVALMLAGRMDEEVARSQTVALKDAAHAVGVTRLTAGGDSLQHYFNYLNSAFRS
jgi:hypothetical protein